MTRNTRSSSPPAASRISITARCAITPFIPASDAAALSCASIPTAARSEYGIEHLDWVKITSRRGSSHARAYLTQGIAPGVLITERFWNPECYDSTQETITPGIEECGYNIMSADSFQNPCFATNSYRAFTVKIEKCDRPERIWVESKEFEPFMPTLQNEPVTEEVF